MVGRSKAGGSLIGSGGGVVHPKYRADIDGLRAVAVLAVVGFHAFPAWLKGGFVGVDIFFVISGFLISTIIIGGLERNLFSFSGFYIRRIRRIFPALLFLVVVVFLFGWFTLLADEYGQLGKHISAGVGFVSNFVLWGESGYFDTLVDTKPLLHLWSLGVEEQFYIAWPLLLWAAYKKGFNLIVVTLVVALVSFSLNLLAVSSDEVAAFYSPQTRFWELLSGSLLAQLSFYKGGVIGKFVESFPVFGRPFYIFRRQFNFCDVLSFLGCGLIFVAFFVVSKERSFPGWWAVLPVLGAVLIIYAGSSAWLNRVFLSSRILVWFGIISFPLYLWHWPLLSFARIILGEPPSVLMSIGLVALSIFLAWITYYFIERPIRVGSDSKSVVVMLVVLAFCFGVAGYAVYKLDGLKFRSIAKQVSDLDYSAAIEGYVPCAEAGILSDVALDMCMVNPKIKPTAAIVGDSHAEDKFHGVVNVDDARNWILLGQNSCPPVLGIMVEGSVKGCKERFERVFEWIDHSDSIEIVVFSFASGYFRTSNYSADQFRSGRSPSMNKVEMEGGQDLSRAEIFYVGLDNAISKMERSGKSVVLNVDVPELPWFPRDCLRSPWRDCSLSQDQVLSRQAELRKIVDKLKNKHPAMSVFDPLELFCKEGRCQYTNGGLVMYRDSHHISLRGSNVYAKEFLRMLK